MAEKEYIERGAVMLKIDLHGTNKFGMLDEDIREFVKEIPAADVAPKSETAKEILEEIEALATKHLALLEIISPQMSAVAAGGKHAFDLVLALITELKKKYTEEDDGT